jgi:hypothetical protein
MLWHYRPHRRRGRGTLARSSAMSRSGMETGLAANDDRPGDSRSMIDGELPSDHRSPRSGSKEHAAVNSAAADQ